MNTRGRRLRTGRRHRGSVAALGLAVAAWLGVLFLPEAAAAETKVAEEEREWSISEFQCFSCHDGSVTTPGDATGWVFALTSGRSSHPLMNTGKVPDTVQNAQPAPWPWTSDGTCMECTSCHNVHINTRGVYVSGTADRTDNYLRDAAFMGGPTTSVAFADPDADGAMFCNNCHQFRAKEGPENDTGSTASTHPVGEAVVDGRKYGVEGTVSVGALFRTPVGALGGHLSRNTAGGVVCLTCHMPHGSPGSPLLTLDNSDAETGANHLCQNCHGTSPSLRRAGDESGGHPVNAGTGDGVGSSGRIMAFQPAIILQSGVDTWKTALKGAKAGPGGELICLTCHSVHRGREKSPLLRRENLSPDGNICNDCHADREDLYLTRGHAH